MKAMHMYSRALAAVTFLLVIAGGLVTSTRSGLSVPDWPLSYGTWMPPMVGGIRFEHSHRMIASLVGLMTLILSVWMIFVEKRKWVRWFAIGALGLVAAQGILGGMTVLFLLPAPISILHACLAQTFFAVVVALAFVTSKEWIRVVSSRASRRNDGRILLMTIALIFLQLILGAALRHTGNRALAISHIVTGFLVLVHAILAMLNAFKHPEGEGKLVRPAIFLGSLALIQMSLGMGAFFYTAIAGKTVSPSAGRIFFLTAHQSVGALLLAVSVFLALRVWRMTRVGERESLFSLLPPLRGKVGMGGVC
jgi:cytochrome c oxidase assembly protein subunit 15